MMGIDANVLVRYMARDDAKQTQAADKLIDSAADAADPLFINHVVLCELVWVLRRAYGLDKSRIQDILEQILETAAFAFEDKDIAAAALRDYQNTGADYADCIIGRRNRSLGCEVTVSFDGNAGKLDSFRTL